MWYGYIPTHGANKLSGLVVLVYLYTSYRRGLAEVAYPLWWALLEPGQRDKRRQVPTPFLYHPGTLMTIAESVEPCQHKVNL